jgi:hypothetical protein
MPRNGTAAPERALLDQLLTDSRLYHSTSDYRALLDFAARLRNFAPFNAMLLHVQKPGLTYAASALDWHLRFGRKPKPKARPLLIMWPFGPVALVYDVLDTEGQPLPQDVAAFFSGGHISAEFLAGVPGSLAVSRIECDSFDGGDGSAGSISVSWRAPGGGGGRYHLLINANHSPAVQFTTHAHQLGPLFLGHLAPDRKLNIPERPSLSHQQRELEAESVAYLVCRRNGVDPKSQTYLAGFVSANTTVDDLDVYQIMRAAGAVESALGLNAHTRLGPVQQGLF